MKKHTLFLFLVLVTLVKPAAADTRQDCKTGCEISFGRSAAYCYFGQWDLEARDRCMDLAAAAYQGCVSRCKQMPVPPPAPPTPPRPQVDPAKRFFNAVGIVIPGPSGY